jgi:hypothetical protein
MRLCSHWTLSLCLVAAELGCARVDPHPEPPGISSAGTAGAATPTGAAGNAGSASWPAIDAGASVDGTSGDGTSGAVEVNCGFETHKLARIPPEVLLILDRSESMGDPVPGSQNNRWTELTNAIYGVLAQSSGQVFWGLKTFPTTPKCNVGPGVEVPISATSMIVTSAIMQSPFEVGNGTPTAEAITNAVAYMQTRTTTNPKYLLLATDGIPTCTIAKGPMQSVAAIAQAKAAGLPTFVLGVATSGTTADTTLNDMATAGGEPRAAVPLYYPATNGKEIADALVQITTSLASCSFALDKAPPSPDDVAVNVGTTRVPRDKTQTNGWDYETGAMTIRLFGTSCDILKSGQGGDVSIIFGCPHVIIP